MILTTLGTLAASESAKAAAKPVFEKFVEPHLGTIKQWLSDIKLDNKVDLFESEFVDYLGLTYSNTEFINVLIYPNYQIRLDDFYEPLRIIQNGNRQEYELDKTNLDFLFKFKNVLITDDAGMGKSTIMKWIVRRCINDYLGIPIFIELKKVSSINSLMNEIFNQFGQLGRELDIPFIIKLLSIGKFIIILDGYDEIAQAEIDIVTSQIIELTKKAHHNYFIITSRRDSSLSAFGSFQGFNIKRLTNKQSESIIRKCDAYSPTAISEELINDTRVKRSTIDAFLTNPFLVTLLYNCYFYNRNIPLNRFSFYDEVYTALFKKHDLSKEKFERVKRSGLDIYAFRLVLRKFAFNAARNGVNDYSDVSLIEAIKAAKETLVGVPIFDPILFCEDIIKQVPLMIRDGLHIKWSHKSLQDFFAAESVCHDESKVQIIHNIYNSKEFYRNANLFDFIIEQDYALVREHIIYKILKDYVDYIAYTNEVNPALDQEAREIRGANSTIGEVFVLREARDIDDRILVTMRRLSKKNWNGFSHDRITLNGRKAFVYITNSTNESILTMIENKGLENIFDNKPYVAISGGYSFCDEINWTNDMVNLNSEDILNITDTHTQNEVTRILSGSFSPVRLNFDKVNATLQDIDRIKAKRANDNLLSF